MDSEINVSSERPLRDLDRWREKGEVRLDSRQVVLLFLGCAVVSCVLFSLGIVVGKRIEARARPIAGPADPLEALDRLAAEEAKSEDLSFPRALAEGGGGAVSAGAAAGTASGDQARELGHEEVEERPAKAARPKPPSVAATKATIARVTEAKGSDGSPARSAEVAEASKPESTKRVEGAASAIGKVETAKADSKSDGKAEKSKLRYTLHVTTFQTRGEAVELVKRFEGQGLRAVVTPEVSPDHGAAFRVRVGDYGSYQDAMQAKSEFERKQGRIVYVSKL